VLVHVRVCARVRVRVRVRVRDPVYAHEPNTFNARGCIFICV